jgi:hypothetical protein
MLENKIIPPAAEESITNIVFDSGWIRAEGDGVDIQTNLYTNNTPRMLMWSFEMVSVTSAVYSNHFQPYLIDPNQQQTAMSTGYRWNTHTQSSGGEWYMNTATGSESKGKYRFASVTSDGGKWNMLPVGFGFDIMRHAAMTSNIVIDYKLTVVEEDTTLLVNRN